MHAARLAWSPLAVLVLSCFCLCVSISATLWHAGQVDAMAGTWTEDQGARHVQDYAITDS